MTAVLTPITSPRASTSGPPELPGLSAASVCRMLSSSRPVRARIERPRPLTMPAVTVCRKPYGLPIAIAICPTRKPARVAEPAPVRDPGAATLSTARSESGSSPTTSAPAAAPVGKRHLDRRRAAGDVAVRDEVAVRRDQEAGAGAARARGAAAAGSFHAQMGDRRRDPVHGAGHRRRIRVEQYGVRVARPVNVEQGRTRVAGPDVASRPGGSRSMAADIAPKPAVFKRRDVRGA